MAEIDASIYKLPPPPDVMGQAGGYVGLANALQQSKLLGMQVQGNQGYAAGLAGAVRPDGTLDPAKAAALAPGAGIYGSKLLGDVQDIRGKVLSNQGVGLENQNRALTVRGTKMDQATAQTNALSTRMGALAQTNPNATYDDYASVIGQSLTSGMIQPDIAGAAYKELGLASAKPGGLQAHVMQRYVSTLPNGGATPTQTGVVTEGPNRGAPTYGTQGQFLGKVTGAPVGGVPFALPPGQSEAMTAAGAASGQQFAAARTAAGSFAQRTFPLMQAIPALERLGTKGGGPPADTVNQVKSFIQSLGAGKIAGIDPENVKDFDEANKYLLNYAQQRGAAFGAETNDKLAAAIASNPNTHMSNLAAQDVAKSALAIERMTQAQTLEFSRQGGTPDQFADWSLKWSPNQDARAFALDVMSPDARKKLLGSLKPGTPEYKKFTDSLAIAEANGLVTFPGGAGGK